MSNKNGIPLLLNYNPSSRAEKNEPFRMTAFYSVQATMWSDPSGAKTR